MWSTHWTTMLSCDIQEDKQNPFRPKCNREPEMMNFKTRWERCTFITTKRKKTECRVLYRGREGKIVIQFHTKWPKKCRFAPIKRPPLEEHLWLKSPSEEADDYSLGTMPKRVDWNVTKLHILQVFDDGTNFSDSPRIRAFLWFIILVRGRPRMFHLVFQL